MKYCNNSQLFASCKIANQFILNRLSLIYANPFGLALTYFTHTARHTFASLITLSEGVPIETVSRMLGHRDIRTTQIYAELSLDKIAQDIRALSERIEGKYILID
ncbi:hypothetical protein D0T84_16150 [Dysgonomonas sp. 521]|nr:hypothetical protein [Dysgonomonas sp. 521]